MVRLKPSKVIHHEIEELRSFTVASKKEGGGSRWCGVFTEVHALDMRKIKAEGSGLDMARPATGLSRERETNGGGCEPAGWWL